MFTKFIFNYGINATKRNKIYCPKNILLDQHIITTLFGEFIPFESLSEISFLDIIFRRVRFSPFPKNACVFSFSDLCKRRLIKFLNLIIYQDILTKSACDILLKNHGTNVLFATSFNTFEIYSTHLPHFTVIECRMESNNSIVAFTLFIIKQLKKTFIDSRVGLCVFTNPTNCDLIKVYKLLHPNFKIVIRFHDILNKGITRKANTIRLLKSLLDFHKSGIIDHIESYCKHDAAQLNITYRPNGINPTFIKSIDTNYREYLYKFTGGSISNSDRTNCLRELHEALLSISPSIQNWISESITNTTSDSWLMYPDFARISARSEIYVDIIRRDQNEGASYRLIEALFLNRKIITNRLWIKNEAFYSPDRFFIIGINSISELKNFIENDITPLPESILSYFDSSLWWTDLDPYILSNIKS